jgi:hypothetical protein
MWDMLLHAGHAGREAVFFTVMPMLADTNSIINKGC